MTHDITRLLANYLQPLGEDNIVRLALTDGEMFVDTERVLDALNEMDRCLTRQHAGIEPTVLERLAMTLLAQSAKLR